MFKKLFTAHRIGTMEVANRLVVPAMVTNYCSRDGFATDRYIGYHEAKAKGGWGLIITEDYAVDEHGKGFACVAGLWNDAQIESHRQLTRKIHEYRTKIVAQIYHAGRQTTRVVSGAQPVAPSPIPCPRCRELPRELTLAEIKTIVSQFGDTALRAKQAGFDGVELHGAHGYLLAQFMSSYSNKRTDEYGGPLPKRMRFVREIIEVVRSKVGADFPVLFRISADELMPGGRDIAETRVIARLLESWGIDALHISTGAYGNYGIATPMVIPHAWTVEYAAEIKKLVSVPVITVNRINDPLMADILVDMGKADFVAMGRGSLGDPDLPNKAKQGDLEGIRYCLSCLQGCTGNLRGANGGSPISCAVNPTLGFERQTSLGKASQRKKILIVGGGPAGMEAARAAALKGHDVCLYEKRAYLGGQFKCAAYAPYKGEFAEFTAWQIAELKKTKNVIIHLQIEATPRVIEEERPDVIIVASGAQPILPDIPGIDRANVFTAEQLLLNNQAAGKCCFVAGGGSLGVEMAAYLALHSKSVTVAEMRAALAEDEQADIRAGFLKVLDEYHVQQITNARVVEITQEGVVVDQNGNQLLYPCDTVVIALGYRKEDSLLTAINGLAKKVVVVGDATGPARLLQATRSGFVAGLEA
jgi:2,4-dienoyl-CoA reductase-like NADH-dependent reductase (Old Yellow Enzyme family)/thioredoxin reductase